MTKRNKTAIGVAVAALVGGVAFLLTRKKPEEEDEGVTENGPPEVLEPGEPQRPREEVPVDDTQDLASRIREELERLRDVGEELTRGREPAPPPQFGPPPPPPPEEEEEEEPEEFPVRSPGQPQPPRAPVNQAPPVFQLPPIVDDLEDVLEGAIPILDPAPAPVTTRPAPPAPPPVTTRPAPPAPAPRRPDQRAPEPIAEGPDETVPVDTLRLLREMLPPESTPVWKTTEAPSLKDWQRARGLVADGNFGPATALTLAEESSVVPIVRKWPVASGANPQRALNEYRAALRALGRDVAAERERGQSFGRPFGAPDAPIEVTVTL